MISAREIKNFQRDDGTYNEDGEFTKSSKVTKEPTLVKHLKNQKESFKGGDFEKIDKSIKVQMQALIKNDLETVRKCRNKEMTDN